MQIANSSWKKIIGVVFVVSILAVSQLVAAVKVACVGDSITAGSGLKNAAVEAYPAQLGKLLGADYEVKNFGVSGRTLLNQGDFPYTKEKAYENALAWQADIVVIALGTNDSKPQNYDKFGKEFAGDYKVLIKSFRDANSKAKIYICLPPPVTPPGAWGIREEIIAKKIIPQIKQVAQDEQTELIDFHSALRGKKNCFPDKVHPNAEGATVMAETLYQAVTGKEIKP